MCGPGPPQWILTVPSADVDPSRQNAGVTLSVGPVALLPNKLITQNIQYPHFPDISQQEGINPPARRTGQTIVPGYAERQAVVVVCAHKAFLGAAQI